MVDLEYILPDAVDKYGSLDDRFQVDCSAEESALWLNQYIMANMTWLCSCRHQDGETLLSFRTKVQYQVGVQQQSDRILTTILQAFILQT